MWASILRGLVWFGPHRIVFLFFVSLGAELCTSSVLLLPTASVAFPWWLCSFLYSVGPLKQFGFMVSSLKNLNGPNRLSLHPLNWCPCLLMSNPSGLSPSSCHHWPHPVGADPSSMPGYRGFPAPLPAYSVILSNLAFTD